MRYFAVQILRTNNLVAVKCKGKYNRHTRDCVIMTKAMEVVYKNDVFKPSAFWRGYAMLMMAQHFTSTHPDFFNRTENPFN